MNIWIDAQLPPMVARWIVENFDVKAVALRDLELRDAQDLKLFETYSSSNKSSL